MTSTTLLRSAAVATGLVGLIDPSWTARRPAPVPVEVKAPADLQRAAGDVRRNLENQLRDRITFDSDAQPAAVVLVGRTGSMTSLDRDGVSISTVSLGSPAPNVRVIAAVDPDPVRVGWTATVGAVVEGVGMAGKASRIVLEQRGVEIAREEHRWKENAERFDARLHYTPPSSGTSTVTLRVLPFDGEAVVTDNAVDLRLAVSERRLNVLVHEPRPSWNAAFVRRSLEQDPSFEVSTIVQASKGLAVRAGSPPAALTAAALSPFDVVLIGAPEELRQSEIEALLTFARIRGGAVVFLPDRRPAGRYLELIPSAKFDEVLVDSAIAIQSIAGAPLRASEIAVFRASLPGASVLASIELSIDRGKRPVVLEWPVGAGRIVFSGAMDAWRFRAAPDDGFGRFWRSRIAEAAAAAPSRLEASITPGVPRPGQDVTIRARIRPTELERLDRWNPDACRARASRRRRWSRRAYPLVADGRAGCFRRPLRSAVFGDLRSAGQHRDRRHRRRGRDRCRGYPRRGELRRERTRASTDCGVDRRSGGRGFRLDPSRAPLARPDEGGGRTADSSGAVDGDALTLRRVARGGVDNSQAAGESVMRTASREPREEPQ